MNELTQWQEKNDQYLAAALSWLRLRLARLARSVQREQPPAVREQPSCWFRRRRKAHKGAAVTTEKVRDSDVTKAADAMADAAAVTPPPALIMLCQRLGLTEFEKQVLLLCAAMELDTRLPGLCAAAGGLPERPYPTFALAMTLFDDPAWDALSAERPLRYWRLVEISQPGATPLTMSALRADERMVNYIKGLNQLDDRLMPFLVPFDVPANGEHSLAASHQLTAGTIEQHLRRSGPAGRPPIIQLTGSDPVSKQQVARRVLARLGWQGFHMPGELLPSAAGEVETLARLWQRESIILPLALFMDAGDDGEGDGPSESRLRLNRFFARCGTTVFLDTREPRTGLGLNTLSCEVDKPLPAEQQAAWKEALAGDAGDNPELLAGQFSLNLPVIGQTAREVIAGKKPEDDAPVLQQRLWEACLNQTRPRLERLAQRIDPRSAWDQLVLPGEPLNLLHDIADQVRQRSKVYDQWGFRRTMSRGFGISALFAGDSGTGKTMAAEVIASELRLDLYRIDLSAVVSKYIGETEKNLRRLFDAAEDGGVILFFDEADALFGKRSEVKDSHDRYANIEINYLLQRMEAFRGLAILATNMKSALDQAFMRRLRFIVNFPFPGLAERKLIWERAFPADDPEHGLSGTPVESLDYDHLARLNFTGGSIHNVALNAAFLAARAGSAVTMPLIFEAARAEFRKLQKPVNEADFLSLNPVGARA